MKKNIPYILTIIIAVLLVIIGNKIAVKEFTSFQRFQEEIFEARVLRITDRTKHDKAFADIAHLLNYEVTFEAKILKGEQKGEVVTAVQMVHNMEKLSTREVRKGDRIFLLKTRSGLIFTNYVRIYKMIALGALFAICIIIFSRKKGFSTLLSLSLTCAAVFAVLIPSVISGKNVYLMAFLVCVYTTLMTLLLIIGINKKSLAASIGCISGILVAALITIIMDKLLFLTGVLDEHSRYLLNLPLAKPINLNAVIFAGIVIGSMGAIMDVAMSISSSMWEIRENAEKIKFEDLFRSGLNIGRDIMGSMANTLILAYIGSSLSLVLVLSVYNNSLFGLLNSEMIIVEILQALAGSFGILFAMPLTAFFSSLLYLKGRGK